MKKKATKAKRLVIDKGDAERVALRDYFAAMAIPVAHEAYAHGRRKDGDNAHYTYEDEIDAGLIAESAYCIADAMLAARGQA
jgi:hypothetical protein